MGSTRSRPTRIGRRSFPTAALLYHRPRRETTAAAWRGSPAAMPTPGAASTRATAAKPTIVAAMYNPPETLVEEPGPARRRRLPLPSCRAVARGSRRPSRAPRCGPSSPPPGSMPVSRPTIPSAVTSPGCSSPPSQDVGCSIVPAACATSRWRSPGGRRHGGEIRPASRSPRSRFADGRATGLRLKDGDRIAIDGPIAVNADPRHLVLDLLGEAAIGAEIGARIRRYEWGPSFFVLYIALDRPLPYKAGPDAMKAATSTPRSLGRPFRRTSSPSAPAGPPDRPMVGIVNELAIDPLARAARQGAD